MDFQAFLNDICASPAYRNQIVHSRTVPSREAEYGETSEPLSRACRQFLSALEVERLYSHQAQAVDLIRGGQDTLITTGTASGKTLCYQIPLIEMLEKDRHAKALLLYPTKALSQDQFQSFKRSLGASGLADTVFGVFDGDTPASMRRNLRDNASLILTNPDMLHASILPQHTRWADFLHNLKYVVIDELHTYSGLFGSNAANLFRRFTRVCNHYNSHPTFIFCSATIGNPAELAGKLTEREVEVVDNDGSPQGKRTYVFWNPPQTRTRLYRSRRSANVEAQELMVELVRAQIPTITFSKAIVTAELIYRYVTETLYKVAPQLAKKVTPYRGGYIPAERREIERKLFTGELLGVSTTRALELGIDIGGLDASVIVGYPGTLAAFFQQSGRAGRRDRESLSVLVAVDTAVNQYVMNHPEYIFGRPIERIVLGPDNPYVLAGQLRCAAFELPIAEEEVERFGKYAGIVLDVLVEQNKLYKTRGKWYHASDDIPQHEVGLRWSDQFNVAITDVDTGLVIGQLSKYDAQPIIHRDAIYLHQGEPYLVLDLDPKRNLCLVKHVDVDYYTQPLGGEDVHHIDQPFRKRDFGCAELYFGEVTVHTVLVEYEKINFYSLDATSRHKIDVPPYQLDTMALWITPTEELTREVVAEGFDVHRGLMGIGYAARMILPLFIQCETLDFSHSSCTAVNAPWHTMFIYERYPHGLGFTEQAYEIMPDVIQAVYDRIKKCDCLDGCPCCVGKPLRGYTTYNIERGEASIPSKASALRILKGIIGDGKHLRTRDTESLGQDEEEKRLLIERGIRRRLEVMTDPQVFHPIDPKPEVGYPDPEQPAHSRETDIARRAFKRMRLEKSKIDINDPATETVKPVEHEAAAGDTSRIGKESAEAVDAELEHERIRQTGRDEAKALRGIMRKVKSPAPQNEPVVPNVADAGEKMEAIELGDSIAARARRLRRKKS